MTDEIDLKGTKYGLSIDRLAVDVLKTIHDAKLPSAAV